MTSAKDEMADGGATRAEGVAPRGAADRPAERLDEALEQSMDASDPPSDIQPGGQDGADEAEAHPS